MKTIPSFERLLKAAKFSARKEYVGQRSEKTLLNFIKLLSKRTGKNFYYPNYLSATDLSTVSYRGQMKSILQYAYKMITDKEMDNQQLCARIDDISKFVREFLYNKESNALSKWL